MWEVLDVAPHYFNWPIIFLNDVNPRVLHLIIRCATDLKVGAAHEARPKLIEQITGPQK